MTTHTHEDHSEHGHHTHEDHTPEDHAQGGHAHGGHEITMATGCGGGHDGHAGHDPDQFRRKFWWTLLLAVPVVAFS